MNVKLKIFRKENRKYLMGPDTKVVNIILINFAMAQSDKTEY